MRTSSDHILTSHVGSLPRPDQLIEVNRARETGEATDERSFQEKLRASVVEVVRRQKDLGIDIPGDGTRSRLRRFDPPTLLSCSATSQRSSSTWRYPLGQISYRYVISTIT